MTAIRPRIISIRSAGVSRKWISAIFDALARHVREDQIVLDLVNIAERGTLQGKVIGLCW
jgi:hypothetical protein